MASLAALPCCAAVLGLCWLPGVRFCCVDAWVLARLRRAFAWRCAGRVWSARCVFPLPARRWFYRYLAKYLGFCGLLRRCGSCGAVALGLSWLPACTPCVRERLVGAFVRLWRAGGVPARVGWCGGSRKNLALRVLGFCVALLGPGVVRAGRLPSAFAPVGLWFFRWLLWRCCLAVRRCWGCAGFLGARLWCVGASVLARLRRARGALARAGWCVGSRKSVLLVWRVFAWCCAGRVWSVRCAFPFPRVVGITVKYLKFSTRQK